MITLWRTVATMAGMTALRGLREAAFLLAVAAAVAAAAATVWVAGWSGGFVSRFGICLIVIGVALTISGDVALGRAATADALAWLGRAPERAGPDDGGGRVLTGVGIFLFVGVPLVAVGVALVPR